MLRFIPLLLFLPFFATAQTTHIDSIFKNAGEVYFSFEVNSKEELNSISKIVSLDHGSKLPKVFAYANKRTFTYFLALNIPYTLEASPGSQFTDINMLLSLETKQLNNWDFYPSYDVYVEMMYAFEDQYPDLCKVTSIGNTVDGRELLVAKLTDSLTVAQNEPKVLFTSSMHGDEISGFVLSLRLIDFLLKNYESDPEIHSILNNVELWINPLANPDGTYRNNNNSIFNASRYNANWIDLNRNYPDPEDGPHPDGNPYQPETIAFMNFTDSVGFDLSSNFHSGAVVANYPWDTWSNITADVDWWLQVMTQYASLAQQNSSNDYFSQYENGITNGNEWYEVAGGRQDYMNYYEHCREFTLELSDDKTPIGADLPFYWEANKASLLAYIQQSVFGLRGVVTDSLTGEALLVKVFIENYDIDNSEVYSHLPIGNYHRYLSSGVYSLTFSADEYVSKTFNNVSVLNNETTFLDVQLVKNNLIIEELTTQLKIYPQPARDFVFVAGIPEQANNVHLIDATGARVRSFKLKGSSIVLTRRNTSAGQYHFVYYVNGVQYSKPIIFE